MESKKRKWKAPQYYAKRFRKNLQLTAGMRGFLVFSNRNQDRAMQEALQVLRTNHDNNNVDNDDVDNNVDDDLDIESALESDMADLKSARNNEIFQPMQTGASNLGFIKTTLREPNLMIESILNEILRTRTMQGRYMLRLLPIQRVCKAYEENLREAAEQVLPKWFEKDKKDQNYAVVYKSRFNENLFEEETQRVINGVIRKLNPRAKVKLKEPEYCVVVEVIKNMCCLGVVKRYFSYRKCNLMELAKHGLKENVKNEVDKGESKELSKDDNDIHLAKNEKRELDKNEGEKEVKVEESVESKEENEKVSLKEDAEKKEENAVKVEKNDDTKDKEEKSKEQRVMSAARSLKFNLSNGKMLVTPTAFVNVSKGCVPHLTRDTLDLIQNIQGSEGFVVGAGPFVAYKEALKSQGKGVAGFSGLSSSSVLACSPLDPLFIPQKISNVSRKSTIPMWHKNNCLAVSPELFMDVAEEMQVDIVLCPSDALLEPNCSSKRLSRSVDNTLGFLDTCLERRQKSTSSLKNTLMLAGLVGGSNAHCRLLSARKSSERDVQGFWIDPVDFKSCEIWATLKESLSVLPEEKLKMYIGDCDPQSVLKLVKMGVDLFDCSYAVNMANADKALIFDYKKVENLSENGISLDLKNNDDFKTDFRPIIEDCECHTCRNHTRGYIHHLLSTNELLGPVLLMIHNLHHYKKFFEYIRNSVCNKDDSNDHGIAKEMRLTINSS